MGDLAHRRTPDADGQCSPATRRVSGSALAVVVSVCVVLLLGSGCSRIQRHFSGSAPTRKGVLTVNPANGPVGSTFTLVASGFLPGEAMTFEIDASNHNRFVGPRHVAGADGKVTTSYTPQAGNPKGIYVVKAVGDKSTRASAKLTVQ